MHKQIMTQEQTEASLEKALAVDPFPAVAPVEQRHSIVSLDPDHPGFRDPIYRARRNKIAQIAFDYVPGSPIPDAPYTEQEHEVWHLIRNELTPRHEKYACAEFLECGDKLKLPRDRIPQLSEMSAKVQALSGFRLEPVAGLVHARVFLESLANGVFLSTQYIRHYSSPLYTPEPDVVHELMGHAMMLASPRISELSRLVGEAVRRTDSDEGLERLGRVYWYTIEFGVVREAGAVKAYGAGLLSSAGELESIQRAQLLPFDLEAASHQAFDPTTFQPFLYCADSFDSMFTQLRDFLSGWN